MTDTKPDQARRVVVYLGKDGWRYRVQAKNWRTIEASEQGFALKRTILKRVAKRWPGVELIVEDGK